MEINILVFYNIDMLISGEDGAGVSGPPADTVRICVVFAVSDVCDKDCSLPADIWLPWMKTAVDYLMGFGWRLHLFRSVYTQPGWPSLLIWFILPILCCQNMERIFTALSLAAPSFQSAPGCRWSFEHRCLLARLVHRQHLGAEEFKNSSGILSECILYDRNLDKYRWINKRKNLIDLARICMKEWAKILAAVYASLVNIYRKCLNPEQKF